MRRRTNPDAPVILLNKPYGTLCQFTDTEGRATLSSLFNRPGYYAAGRLDRDSEGLVILTNDGALQHHISNPKYKQPKQYLVQVEGMPTTDALEQLSVGIELRDGPTAPARVVRAEPPETLWPREPPVRFRRHIPTTWLRITLTEGRNRQVRRMTAAVGFPTLRLIRTHVGDWSVWGIEPGCWITGGRPKSPLSRGSRELR